MEMASTVPIVSAHFRSLAKVGFLRFLGFKNLKSGKVANVGFKGFFQLLKLSEN